MRPDGSIKQLRLAVDIPSLNDTASDWDHIQKPLLPLLDGRPLQDSLVSLRDLGSALRRGVRQAVRIGLLPDIPHERIRFIGNSSLAGAHAAPGLAARSGNSCFNHLPGIDG